MLNERIEAKWIDMFEEIFVGLTKVRPGEVVAILSETQSRRLLVDLSELALSRLGVRLYHVVLPTPRAAHPVELRSTGTCLALGNLRQVIDALAGANLVIDLTVEGLLHSPERKDILARGARMLMISNEHLGTSHFSITGSCHTIDIQDCTADRLEILKPRVLI